MARRTRLLAFHFELFDLGGVEREDTFDAFVVDDAADGEGGVDAVALLHDDGAGEDLDTFLVAFDDALVDIDDVADFELGGLGLEVLGLNVGHECVLHCVFLGQMPVSGKL